MTRFALLASLALALPAHAGVEEVRFAFQAQAERNDGTPLDPAEIERFEFACAEFTPTGGLPGVCDSDKVSVPGLERRVSLLVNVPDIGGKACFVGRTFVAGDPEPVWGLPSCSVFKPKVKVPVTLSTEAYELRVKLSGAYSFAKVGTVPLGAPCSMLLTGKYHVFYGATITQPLKGGVIAARCG